MYLNYKQRAANRCVTPRYRFRRLLACMGRMGQVVGNMPDSWDSLLEGKDRVLYCSSKVLSRTADNVYQEELFLVDYNDESIDKKLESWMESNCARIDRIFSKHPNLPESYKVRVTIELEHITDEFRIKMRNDYCHAYKDIKKFTKRVDELGERQRKIHMKIQNLERVDRGNMRKFQKKFTPLRIKTFKHARLGEKMMFRDKRLKEQFIKRVYDIDHKNVEECARCVDKLIKTIEKAALK